MTGRGPAPPVDAFSCTVFLDDLPVPDIADAAESQRAILSTFFDIWAGFYTRSSQCCDAYIIHHSSNMICLKIIIVTILDNKNTRLLLGRAFLLSKLYRALATLKFDRNKFRMSRHPVFLTDFLQQLLAYYSYLLWRIYTDPDLVSVDVDDSNLDIFADQNSLVLFSSQY
jgi:hypothetical protein